MVRWETVPTQERGNKDHDTACHLNGQILHFGRLRPPAADSGGLIQDDVASGTWSFILFFS